LQFLASVYVCSSARGMDTIMCHVFQYVKKRRELDANSARRRFCYHIPLCWNLPQCPHSDCVSQQGWRPSRHIHILSRGHMFDKHIAAANTSRAHSNKGIFLPLPFRYPRPSDNNMIHAEEIACASLNACYHPAGVRASSEQP